MIQHVVLDLDGSRTEEQLAALLRRDGALTFEGVPDRAALVRLARQVMSPRLHRDSEDDGVTVIRDRGDLGRQPGYAGFGRGELMPHTESSAMARPSRLMMLSCARNGGSGGACRLLDGAALYHALAERHPELLASMLSPRSVLFGGAAGHLSSVFEELAGRMVVRFRLDDLVQFSPQITRRMSTLRALITELTLTKTLPRGHGYLLCNTRWLHGREAFRGDRVLYRILGDPLSKLAIPVGFPATVPATSAVA